MNDITMRLQADHLIMEALKEDISSEDVTLPKVAAHSSNIRSPRRSSSCGWRVFCITYNSDMELLTGVPVR